MKKVFEIAIETVKEQSANSMCLFFGLMCVFAGSWMALNSGAAFLTVGVVLLYLSLFYSGKGVK